MGLKWLQAGCPAISWCKAWLASETALQRGILNDTRSTQTPGDDVPLPLWSYKTAGHAGSSAGLVHRPAHDAGNQIGAHHIRSLKRNHGRTPSPLFRSNFCGFPPRPEPCPGRQDQPGWPSPVHDHLRIFNQKASEEHFHLHGMWVFLGFQSRITNRIGKSPTTNKGEVVRLQKSMPDLQASFSTRSGGNPCRKRAS